MRFKTTLGCLLVGATLIGAMGAAVAQKSPADIIKARQDLMKGFGGDLKTITDQLKTDAPDKAAIAAAFKHIADNNKGVAGSFPAGTGPDTGIKMRAKAEIWAQPADFKAAADSFVTVSAKTAQMAAAGDVDTLKAQAKALGDACGGCHMKFRAPAEPAK